MSRSSSYRGTSDRWDHELDEPLKNLSIDTPREKYSNYDVTEISPKPAPRVDPHIKIETKITSSNRSGTTHYRQRVEISLGSNGRSTASSTHQHSKYLDVPSSDSHYHPSTARIGYEPSHASRSSRIHGETYTGRDSGASRSAYPSHGISRSSSTRDRSHSYAEPEPFTYSASTSRRDRSYSTTETIRPSRSHHYSTHGYSSRAEHSRYDGEFDKDQSKSKHSSSRYESSRPTPSSTRHTDSRRSYDPRGSYLGSTRRDDKTWGKSSLKTITEGPLDDYYSVLGISPRASSDEIRKAARTMRVESHPDKLKKSGMSRSQKEEVDNWAAKIGQAADVLTDPHQKVKYDEKRARMGL